MRLIGVFFILVIVWNDDATFEFKAHITCVNEQFAEVMAIVPLRSIGNSLSSLKSMYALRTNSTPRKKLKAVVR